MSALRGSRKTARLSAVIAPFQSSAQRALLPDAKSGSSCAQSDSVPIAAMVVQIGQASVPLLVSGVRPNQAAIVFRQTGPLEMYNEAPAISVPKTAAAAITRLIGCSL